MPTNATKGSRVKAQLRTISFAELWDAYPSGTPYVDPKTRDAPPGFENQCAIRMSVMLHKLGIEMQSFRGRGQIRLDGKRTAVLASEMADWLRLRPIAGIGEPEAITGTEWEQKIHGRQGIVAFKNFWRRTGESSASGGHIDLWNGSRMTVSSSASLLSVLGRSMGVPSARIPGTSIGYSDLGQATEILFWEVK